VPPALGVSGHDPECRATNSTVLQFAIHGSSTLPLPELEHAQPTVDPFSPSARRRGSSGRWLSPWIWGSPSPITRLSPDAVRRPGPSGPGGWAQMTRSTCSSTARRWGSRQPAPKAAEEKGLAEAPPGGPRRHRRGPGFGPDKPTRRRLRAAARTPGPNRPHGIRVQATAGAAWWRTPSSDARPSSVSG